MPYQRQRKSSSTSGSSWSNTLRFWSTTAGMLLPRVTPNSATVHSAKNCCDIVNILAYQSQENRQPAYRRNHEVLIGTHWCGLPQSLSHQLVSRIVNMSSTCITTTIETSSASPKRITHPSASHCSNPRPFMPHTKFWCLSRVACFKSHGLRHNLTTLPDIGPHPSGRHMYTSSLRSGWTNSCSAPKMP